MFSTWLMKMSLLSLVEKKVKTDLVEVKRFSPQVLSGPLRLALAKMLATVIAN